MENKTSKAFLQRMNGEWLEDFVYISKEPLKRRGFDIITIDGPEAKEVEEQLDDHSIDKNRDIMIGSVESTSLFFKKAGVNIPEYIGFPTSSYPYLGRKIKKVKFKEVEKETFPVFIKPANGVKDFTGCVVDNETSMKNFKLIEQPDGDMEVIASEVLNIDSEYRCFIDQSKDDKLRGINYYQGNVRKFPDVKIIDDMIHSMSNDLPVCCTLDVGVTEKNETILIEINDMWAVGHYGLDSEEYVRMNIKRQRQILGSVFFTYLV